MLPLPHRRTWYAIGIVLTLFVIVASLVPSRELPRLHLSDKTEHALAYTALALWFGGLFELRRYGWLLLGLLALGGGIEIAQGAMGLGREADWKDFYADAAGAAVGLVLCLIGLRHWARWLERWLSRK